MRLFVIVLIFSLAMVSSVNADTYGAGMRQWDNNAAQQYMSPYAMASLQPQIDATGIQFRMLNRSKGPAMHSPRAQADKAAYSHYMRCALEQEKNIDLLQDTVTGIECGSGVCTGVILTSGRIIHA